MTHRVLIVDDDDKVREVLRRFLEPEGYEVIQAGSAEDAVRMVEVAAPSVAFCDVHMTGANGLWLADQIRTLSPATAMVLATGDSQIPSTESLRAGVVSYLLKPLRRERVVAAAAEGVRWSEAELSRGVRRQPQGRLPGAH
jgi:two-component system NtrC family response regulator